MYVRVLGEISDDDGVNFGTHNINCSYLNIFVYSNYSTKDESQEENNDSNFIGYSNSYIRNDWFYSMVWQ